MSWYFETQADNQAPDRHGPYNSINAALDAKDRTRATLAKLNDGIERRFSPVYEADAAVAEAAADHDQRNDEAAAKWQAEVDRYKLSDLGNCKATGASACVQGCEYAGDCAKESFMLRRDTPAAEASR